MSTASIYPKLNTNPTPSTVAKFKIKNMKEIKYTSDNKKVIVVGKLNAQETIVQEIFISNDNEIPSGENFVVKSLHDTPVVSWKEKSIKDMDADYEKRLKEFEKLTRDLRLRQELVKEKFEQIGFILKKANEEVFTTLVDYISGNIKWIVETGYTPKLVEFKDFNEISDREMRLISIFGKSDGDLTYAIGTYSDYSGGYRKFKPFTNYEDALACYSELLCNSTITTDVIEAAKKYNITLPENKVTEYRNKTKESLLANIKRNKEDVDKWQGMILEIERS